MRKYNMNSILTAANEQVRFFMLQGYMISFGNASFGYKFRVDLERGEKHIRVKVVENYHFTGSVFTLTVLTIDAADDFERETAEVLYTKSWYALEELGCYGSGDYVFTDDEAIYNEAIEKRKARYAARRMPVRKSLTPSRELIRHLKTYCYGFTNATRNTIVVYRTPNGYEVGLKARDGHVSRTQNVNFPKH